jgi:hypothetical protein
MIAGEDCRSGARAQPAQGRARPHAGPRPRARRPPQPAHVANTAPDALQAEQQFTGGLAAVGASSNDPLPVSFEVNYGAPRQDSGFTRIPSIEGDASRGPMVPAVRTAAPVPPPPQQFDRCVCTCVCGRLLAAWRWCTQGADSERAREQNVRPAAAEEEDQFLSEVRHGVIPPDRAQTPSLRVERSQPKRPMVVKRFPLGRSCKERRCTCDFARGPLDAVSVRRVGCGSFHALRLQSAASLVMTQGART